jgi:hypothetical protein
MDDSSPREKTSEKQRCLKGYRVLRFYLRIFLSRLFLKGVWRFVMVFQKVCCRGFSCFEESVWVCGDFEDLFRVYSREATKTREKRSEGNKTATTEEKRARNAISM